VKSVAGGGVDGSDPGELVWMLFSPGSADIPPRNTRMAVPWSTMCPQISTRNGQHAARVEGASFDVRENFRHAVTVEEFVSTLQTRYFR